MNAFLFLSTALIWGSTWLGIKFQLGEVTPLWSLVYRFSLAASILLGYCLIVGHSLSFNRQQHKRIALQAFFLFFLNYYLFYLGSTYFVSGIVAVLFATTIIFNIVNSKIFMGHPIVLRTVAGAIIGLLGLICIIWAEVIRLEDKNFWFIAKGLALCLGGAMCASLGQITSVSNYRYGLPLVQTTAIGYVYGVSFTIALALLLNQAPAFDTAWPYVGSLLYLAFFGTVIAFGCFLTLATRIGPDKAAYAFILLPIIAMGLSSFFETFTWHPSTVLGIACIIVGNLLVLTKEPFTLRLNHSDK